jgi:hypothetical protein
VVYVFPAKSFLSFGSVIFYNKTSHSIFYNVRLAFFAPLF